MKPQRAKVYDPDKHDASKYMVSLKMDGVRAIWDGKRYWTRNEKQIIVPPDWTRLMPNVVLDGEIYAKHVPFDTISGTVRKKNPDMDVWGELEFHIFDAPEAKGGLEARREVIEKSVGYRDLAGKHNRIVPQMNCSDAEHLDDMFSTAIGCGFEGVMMRHRTNGYTPGARNSDLLKCKRMLDMEAVVIGHEVGKGQHKGRLGALLCQANGVSFKVGTGFDVGQREDPPPIGATITISYQELTAAGKPRFPVFLRVREGDE